MRNARITEVVTQPTENCISLSEAKDHLRVDFATDDAYILSLVIAAQDIIERYTWRKFITTTLRTYYDRFPDVIELPHGTVQSITSIIYVDDDGVEQTLSSSLYQADIVNRSARIKPAYNESWPSIREQMNAVKVEYVCGYGDAFEVPAALKQACLLLIGHFYENREQVVVGAGSQQLPFSIEALMQPYKLSLV